MEQPAPVQRTVWTPRQVALATIIVLAIALAFWLMFRFRLVFFSLFIAIVLSTAIEPLVTRLGRLGIPRPVSIILISLLVLLMLVFLILIIIPLVSEQWLTITSMLSSAFHDIRQALIESPSLLVRRIARQLPAALPFGLPAQAPAPLAPAEQQSLDLVQQVFDYGRLVLRSLILTVSVLLLTGLWILEGEVATRVVLLAVPQQRRENMREFLVDIQNKVGAYTRGLAILSLFIGVFSGIAYAIIGLPNVLLLGIFAGLMEIVPLIGPALGAIPAIFVAASMDPDKVIWVIGTYAFIQFAENNFLVPRVMDRAVGVNPVASLLAFIAFGSIFGFLGAVLAVPLAAVIQLALRRFVFDAPPAEQAPIGGRTIISTLRYEAQDLVQDVRKQVRDKDAEAEARSDHVEDSLESIAQDLDSVLASVELAKNPRRRRNDNRAVQ